MENILVGIVSILRWIAIILVILLVLYCIFTIINFIESKTEKNKLSKYDLPSKQIISTNDFFDLIDYLINNEIAKVLSPNKLLNNPYQITNMDTDYQNISTSVYKAIKPSLIDHDGLAIDKEYVLQYIINRTHLLFFNAVIDFNRSFRVG